MKIDNKKNTLKIWLQKLVATVIFTPLLMFILFSRYFKVPVFGIDREIYLVVTIVLYAGLMVWHYLLRPCYLYYSDNGERIILRYYRVSALNRKKHAIEIPKDQFVKYETKRFFPGIEKIFLFQRVRKGIARYPGVSLSIVSKSDQDKIKRSLSQYVRVKS